MRDQLPQQPYSVETGIINLDNSNGHGSHCLKKRNTKKISATKDAKNKSEILSLASVDPNEIVVFQDKQGEMKTNNFSMNDIFVKMNRVTENSLAVFDSTGKIKPGGFFYQL